MIGQTLSHYHILEKLGTGGMGEVYLAHDPRLDRQVAIKLLPAHLTADVEICFDYFDFSSLSPNRKLWYDSFTWIL